MPHHIQPNFFTPQQLLAELVAPDAAEFFSPMGEQPYVLVDLQDAAQDQLVPLADKLGQLCCPIIALGDIPHSAVPMFDVVVASHEEAGLVVNACRANPHAAMTLVQLLRHNEHCSLADGLWAESLAYATLQGGVEFKRWLAQRSPRKAPVSSAVEPAVLISRNGSELDITLNRPGRRNAFSRAMRDGLVEALRLLPVDVSITHVRISGAGKCFSTGGDLDEFGDFSDTASAHAIRSIRNAGRLISQHAEKIECHVHGACIGAGIELPAFCAHIEARHDSYFKLPEIAMGLIPGAGGTASILRRVGRQRTTWLALSGQAIDATTALEWGLVDRLV